MCVSASVYKQRNLFCIFICVYLVLSKTPIQQLVSVMFTYSKYNL